MAGDGDSRTRTPSIPSWQQIPPSTAEEGASQAAPEHTELDPLEQARLFLQHDDIKDAPHEEKAAFLERKGIKTTDIQKLLGHPAIDSSSSGDGLKTIHDSNDAGEQQVLRAPLEPPATSSSTDAIPPQPSAVSEASAARVASRADVPPIITYPEFLMKPQKPPPLVTIDRLATASYIIGGASALTWAASKYLIAPMLESLTTSRHDLASNTLSSLGQLNTKLESSVSHVPYIAPLKSQKSNEDAVSDTSSDSDPTELFHRDHGTQTTPPKSRSSSMDPSNSPMSATITQANRLSSLHSSLSSLLSSTSTSFSTDALSTSISDLQGVIDRIESNSQPLYTNYDWKAAPSYSSTSKSTSKSDKDSQGEAAKFKAEIRALKGAFLSSRNFPSAPRSSATAAAASAGR
jgi:hypothetical protein